MKRTAAFLVMLFAGRLAFAPDAAPAARGAAPAADIMPANLDHTLVAAMTIDANAPLDAFTEKLRSITHANIVVNWNALSLAGVSKDTPVALHLKDVPFEQVIKTLCEILPAADSRVNYTVGDNILTITTDAELGKVNVPVIDDVTHAVSYTLEKEITPKQKTENEKFLEAYFREALRQAGEPMEARGHALAVKGTTLAATVSNRGREILEKALRRIDAPTKPGEYASGMLPSVRQKKAAALLAAVRNPSLGTLALGAADHPYGLNIALFLGTLNPETHEPADALAKTITGGGIVLIGPRKTMARRTVLGVYDLRNLIRRRTARPESHEAPADAQAAIVQSLQSAVPPDDPPGGAWGKMGNGPASMTPFNGLLIVFAPPEKHRAITEALRKMNP